MIKIVPYQTTWIDIFRQEAAILRDVLGSDAFAIHHIGSTSVVGLAAKDVIDIQVTVADLQLPVRSRLERCYFLQNVNISGDHCPAGQDHLPAEELAKFFFSKQEPRINLHIREKGRFNQRYPLLCRDYLRSHPLAAKAYEQIKKQLAHYFPNNADVYYDIKDPVFDIIMAGAEDWARVSNWTIPETDA